VRPHRSERWRVSLVLALLAVYVVVAFGGDLARPFFGDDFLFLEKTRERSWTGLWSFDALAYHFYRPWSRELHFWTLQRLFGLAPTAFHATSLLLWFGVLASMFLWTRRLLGTQVAAIGTAGVAALQAWAVPVPWASGSQDLWMLLWALLCLILFARGAPWLAAIALALALLSKETAITLPAVATLFAWIVERRSAARALRSAAPLWMVALLWAGLHPMLGGRLWHPGSQLGFLAFRPIEVGLGSVRTFVNLERVPDPAHGWLAAATSAWPGAVTLAGLVLAGTIVGRREPARADRTRVLAFAAAWALLAWLPTLMPAVAWQPYYALHAALGAWIILAATLERWLPAAVGLIVVLALLRSAGLDTPTPDWASGWSQREGARWLEDTRRFLMERHPRLPAHSRLFFTTVPRGVMLVAGPGDVPPLRVWYRDSTIAGGYYLHYRPRVAAHSGGRDLFFRHDSLAGWVEVVRGAEDVAEARRLNPRWERDHEILARRLAESGDWHHAALEYAKLAAAEPGRVDHAHNAAVSHEALGDSAAAALWYWRAAALPDADNQVREMARRYERLRGPRGLR
jgi:hypothetical protein